VEAGLLGHQSDQLCLAAAVVTMALTPWLHRAGLWLQSRTGSLASWRLPFRALLPFQNRLIQARWSGEAAWVPLGDLRLDVPAENATSHPSRGDLLFHPGGASETELLFPYGSTCFASKVGQLAGNHFLTITSGQNLLPELGRRVLWEGAQPIRIEPG